MINICDHHIIDIKKAIEDEPAELFYTDFLNWFHFQELEECIQETKKFIKSPPDNCIGVGFIELGNIKIFAPHNIIQIYFKKRYIPKLFKKTLLFGSREQRFMQFKELLADAGYTITDRIC